MPERLAQTDAFTQVTEAIGSGPYRFKTDERIPGARVVYEKFADYVPRDNGKSERTAGPKVANFDRIEWAIMPDASTVSAALQRGEVDWWYTPPADLLPPLRKAKDVKVETIVPTGDDRDDALQPIPAAVRQSGDPPRHRRRRHSVGLHDRGHGRRSDAHGATRSAISARTRRWRATPGWRR